MFEKTLCILVIYFFSFVNSYSQTDYSISNIPESLLKDASAVILNIEKRVFLENRNSFRMVEKNVISVFNREGLKCILNKIPYDDFIKVNNVNAFIYDKDGKKIKKFKKSDFKDLSATGSDMYTDNRTLELEFIIPEYPFTYEIEYEVKSLNTALLPIFDPSPYYDVSTQNALYVLENKKQIPIKKREYKLDAFDIQKFQNEDQIKYIASNIPAMKREYLSPSSREFSPYVFFSPVEFSLGGKVGTVTNWIQFANWKNNALLNQKNELTESTLRDLKKITTTTSATREKIRLIYEYMQSKTRYISVQVGIGSWKPMKSLEVDELGYGDCKALTNYMKTLLSSQGIDSYYTLVNAGHMASDIDIDFPALQGNHAILTVPLEDEYLFLECTSQNLPFNFLGTHTDNRNVIVIKPEGSDIIKTHNYTSDQNKMSLKSKVIFSETFDAIASLEIVSEGLMYTSKYELDATNSVNSNKYYQQIWSYLNNLKVDTVTYVNQKNKIRFSEILKLNFDNYISKVGNRILFQPNIFSRYPIIPDLDVDRKLPLEIRRGETYFDEVEIVLPKHATLTSSFEDIQYKSDFGEYTLKLLVLEDGKLKLQRYLQLYSGKHPASAYEEYVTFIRKIIKADQSKIILSNQ